MHRFRVLITDRFDLDAMARLTSDPNLEVKRSATPQPSTEELNGVEALVIRSRTKIDSALLDQAPQLKMIVTATSGFDHIDLKATEKNLIKVMYTPDANAASAAELTWALMLACTRRVLDAHRAVKNGDWRRETLIGHQLSGKTYGIVGLGRIGTRVARIANAFGMRVIAFDPYKDEAGFSNERVDRVSLEELLKMSDVISFHVPATIETDRMINQANLESVNKGAILVNTSRGSVIDEDDLVKALENGVLSACGLDVFEREPVPRHAPLLRLPNVVLTPHLGATTHEAFSQASCDAAEKVLAFAMRGESSDRLPPEENWYAMGFMHRHLSE